MNPTAQRRIFFRSQPTTTLLGWLLEESCIFNTCWTQRRRGVLDDLSTRAQPIEPQRRYARPAFVSKHNDARHNYNNRASAVDSLRGTNLEPLAVTRFARPEGRQRLQVLVELANIGHKGAIVVAKGYSQYNHIPTRQGDYDHGPQYPIINKNVAETKTNKWAHASASGYTNLSGTPTKFELLWEYVYAPNMVSGYEDYGPNYGLNYKNSAPNKRLLSPVLGYSTQESKQVHSRPGLARGTHIDTGNISGPNKSWQSAGKGLGYVEESVNHSSGLDLRRTQPLEPQSQYERLYFRAKPTNGRNSANTRTTN
ncbi:hypothetical protein Tco_1336528 [Tanacetum coccineum]